MGTKKVPSLFAEATKRAEARFSAWKTSCEKPALTRLACQLTGEKKLPTKALEPVLDQIIRDMPKDFRPLAEMQRARVQKMDAALEAMAAKKPLKIRAAFLEAEFRKLELERLAKARVSDDVLSEARLQAELAEVNAVTVSNGPEWTVIIEEASSLIEMLLQMAGGPEGVKGLVAKKVKSRTRSRKSAEGAEGSSGSGLLDLTRE